MLPVPNVPVVHLLLDRAILSECPTTDDTYVIFISRSCEIGNVS